MKRGLLIAAFLVAIPLAGGTALWAQNEAPPAGPPPGGGMHQRGGPEREVEHLTRMLSLNPDQQTQVKALLAEQRQKMEALRNSNSNADANSQGAPPRRAQMESIRNDTDTKITALLNDDQKTKFAAWQQERKARMEQHQGGGAPEGPPPPQPNN